MPKQKEGESQLAYIIRELEQLVRLGYEEYTGNEMADAIEDLLKEITPKRKSLYEKQCDDYDEHVPHVYLEDGTEYYCRGGG